MERSEAAAVAGVLGAVVGLANLARLLPAVLFPHPDAVYVGELWDAFDLPQYVEAIHEGALGSWLYEGRLWGEPGGGGHLFQLSYLLGGHVAALPGASSLPVLEALRWSGQAVAVLGAALFVRRAAPPGVRAWAAFFAAFAGGLGFLFLWRPATPLGPILPMDVATPSFDLLAAFLGAPHLALMAGCVALFAWGLLAVGAGDRRGFAGLAALAVALTIHPFELVSVAAAAALYGVLVRSRAAAAYLLAATILGGIELGYLALTARSDPGFAAMSQTSLTTEVGNLPSTLVSRAFVLALAAMAVWRARRSADPTVVFLATWAVLALVLNVATFDPAGPLHRSLEGVSLALGALAARALPAGRHFRAALLAACLVSPALTLGGTVIAAAGAADAWVPGGVFRVAAAVPDARGCVAGRLDEVRWLAAESRLCLSGGSTRYTLVHKGEEGANKVVAAAGSEVLVERPAS